MLGGGVKWIGEKVGEEEIKTIRGGERKELREEKMIEKKRRY